MGSAEDMVSKVSQELVSELSLYKTDVNYKLQDLPDEQVRETMSQILEIHERFLESVMEKVLGLIKDVSS